MLPLFGPRVSQQVRTFTKLAECKHRYVDGLLLIQVRIWCIKNLAGRIFRWKNQRLKVLHKFVNNVAQTYLYHEILHSVEENRYKFQNSNKIPAIRVWTCSYDRTFLLKTIQDWNNLPNESREARSCESSTYRLCSTSQEKAPSWSATGNRRASILHSRMWMLCSPLNDHLYSHIRVSDNLGCACGFAWETNKHFYYIVHFSMLKG